MMWDTYYTKDPDFKYKLISIHIENRIRFWETWYDINL